MVLSLDLTFRLFTGASKDALGLFGRIQMGNPSTYNGHEDSASDQKNPLQPVDISCCPSRKHRNSHPVSAYRAINIKHFFPAQCFF